MHSPLARCHWTEMRDGFRNQEPPDQAGGTHFLRQQTYKVPDFPVLHFLTFQQ